MNLISYVSFNFVIYSFIGWIIEEIYCFYTKKTFKKPNFLSIPLKPMYGIAMSMLIIMNEVLGVDIFTFLLLCFIVPTSVEYISGYILKRLFNEVYWSYSNQKHNIKGYVCLKFSFYWQLLSFIGVYYLQPIIRQIYRSMLSYSSILVIVVNGIVMFELMIKVRKIINNH